jgi:hypothetical protein
MFRTIFAPLERCSLGAKGSVSSLPRLRRGVLGAKLLGPNLSPPPRRDYVCRVKNIICIECLRCGHRAVMDRAVLERYGAPPDVPIARLSRHLVCQVCGARSIRAFRASSEEARAFISQ